MAAISKMTRMVVVNAPGVADPIAEDYLLLAAIDFCRRSYAWMETVQESLVAADFPFQVSPPAGANVFKVISVADNGKAPTLEQCGIRELDSSTSNWRTATGIAASFVESPRGTVMVTPLPSQSSTFDIMVACEPTETAKSIPDEIYNEYRDTIISGAIMRLAIIPNTSWTDMNLAVVHRGIYEDGVARALVKFNNNHVLQQMHVSTSPI